MFGVEASHWLMFGLGVVIGGILFSATFRVKFFKSFGEFLAQIRNQGKPRSDKPKKKKRRRYRLVKEYYDDDEEED